jgi:hypothetical protein
MHNTSEIYLHLSCVGFKQEKKLFVLVSEQCIKNEKIILIRICDSVGGAYSDRHLLSRRQENYMALSVYSTALSTTPFAVKKCYFGGMNIAV